MVINETELAARLDMSLLGTSAALWAFRTVAILGLEKVLTGSSRPFVTSCAT
jgi:hypothetical protein